MYKAAVLSNVPLLLKTVETIQDQDKIVISYTSHKHIQCYDPNIFI